MAVSYWPTAAARTPSPLSQELILGIDIGTSSVRAALYDARGRMLPATFVQHERSLATTAEGGSEIDPDVALKQFVRTIDDVLKCSRDSDGEIAGVAVSCFWHSLLGVDEKGAPTTAVLGWADTRSGEFTAALRKRFNESEVHNRTGARFHSSFWPAKLLWLRSKNRRVFDRTAKWLSLSDYLTMKIHEAHAFEKQHTSIMRAAKEWQYSGTPLTSVSIASATGMFDIRECRWDAELLDFLGLHEFNLSRIADTDEPRHRLTRPYSRRWPRLRNALWFPAIGDGAANNIGSGCVDMAKAGLMIGTSGAMRVAYKGEPPKKIPSGLWCYRIDSRRVIIGGALSDGGGLYQWLKERLRLDPSAERELANRPPTDHGITIMPFFAGERSTGYNENATGAILGLNSSTDSIDIFHAALESVAYRFADIFDQLNEVVRVREIVASGGALHASTVWTQILADILRRELTLTDTVEASMRGAVLLALETTGKIKALDEVSTPKGKHFQPNGSRRSAYAAARKRHDEAYKLLIDRDK